MKKKLFAMLLSLSLLLSACGSQGAGSAEEAAASVPAPTPEPTPQVVELSFSASGDNLIHDGLYLQANQRAGGNGYDFSYCYENIKDFFAEHDINWINQETLVNDELPPSTYPMFSTPGEMGHTLYDIGFRVFNQSNNHSYDKGAAGLEATTRFWDAMPDDVVTCGLYHGPEDNGIAFQEVKGVKIAYLGYTEHTNGLPTPQGSSIHVTYTSEVEKMQHQIELAASEADLVIVSNHWGVEGSHNLTEEQCSLAQQQADWGADVIIGTGPHVVQSAEWLTAADGRKTFVAYSLGNFISAQAAADTMIGAVLTFDIQQTIQPDGSKTTEVLSPLLHPVITHYDARYSNIRSYWYSDYSDELASVHGVQARAPGFNMAYIDMVLNNSIPAEFLAK